MRCYRKKKSAFYKLIIFLTVLSFVTGLCPFNPTLTAQPLSDMPQPGHMVQITTPFNPPLIRGLTIHPENPMLFDFFVDKGQTILKDEALKTEYETIIKYFLASLTIPEDDLWVNLSPYEKERIIPDEFGKTEMGRDLLAQDYVLKQLMASLSYPETGLGKKFWDSVYKKAYELYGTTNIPLNTFNKVWIVPDKAVVYEHQDKAFVIESHLKVMMEEDYLSLNQNLKNKEISADRLNQEEAQAVSNLSSSVAREVLIPAIEKEVNDGEHFAKLRQVYQAMILAAWFKKTLKESILNKVYSNQKKIAGVDTDDPQIKEKIYEEYIQAFRKGVYDLIKEEKDLYSDAVIPRKYFSGGVVGNVVTEILESRQTLPNNFVPWQTVIEKITTDLRPAQRLGSEDPSANIPTLNVQLGPQFGKSIGIKELEIQGRTLKELLTDLQWQLSLRGAYDLIFDKDGGVKQLVNIYLNGDDIRFLAGDQKLESGDELNLVAAVAGGSDVGDRALLTRSPEKKTRKLFKRYLSKEEFMKAWSYYRSSPEGINDFLDLVGIDLLSDALANPDRFSMVFAAFQQGYPGFGRKMLYEYFDESWDETVKEFVIYRDFGIRGLNLLEAAKKNGYSLKEPDDYRDISRILDFVKRFEVSLESSATLFVHARGENRSEFFSDLAYYPAMMKFLLQNDSYRPGLAGKIDTALQYRREEPGIGPDFQREIIFVGNGGEKPTREFLLKVMGLRKQRGSFDLPKFSGAQQALSNELIIQSAQLFSQEDLAEFVEEYRAIHNNRARQSGILLEQGNLEDYKKLLAGIIEQNRKKTSALLVSRILDTDEWPAVYSYLRVYKEVLKTLPTAPEMIKKYSDALQQSDQETRFYFLGIIVYSSARKNIMEAMFKENPAIFLDLSDLIIAEHGKEDRLLSQILREKILPPAELKVLREKWLRTAFAQIRNGTNDSYSLYYAAERILKSILEVETPESRGENLMMEFLGDLLKNPPQKNTFENKTIWAKIVDLAPYMGPIDIKAGIQELLKDGQPGAENPFFQQYLFAVRELILDGVRRQTIPEEEIKKGIQDLIGQMDYRHLAVRHLVEILVSDFSGTILGELAQTLSDKWRAVIDRKGPDFQRPAGLRHPLTRNLDNDERLIFWLEDHIWASFLKDPSVADSPATRAVIEERLKSLDPKFNVGGQREAFLSTLKYLKTIFPDFHFEIIRTQAWNTQTKQRETRIKTDLYEMLAGQISREELLSTLYKLRQEQGTVPNNFFYGLLSSLGAGDTAFEINETAYQSFPNSLTRFIEELYSPSGRFQDYHSFFLNDDVLRYLARNPENIDQLLPLPEVASKLFGLLQEGGPLYSNRNFVMQDIFSNGNALARAQTIETIFTKKVPLWEQLFLFTEARLGQTLDHADSNYPITSIGGVSLSELVSEHKARKKTNPVFSTMLESIVASPTIIDQLVRGEIDSIPFSAISGTYKRTIYREYLKNTIATSRDTDAKRKTDLRNRSTVQEDLVMEEGTYLHGSPVDVVDDVLSKGNLPYESLGAESRTDSYPFHVDFSRIRLAKISEPRTVESIINITISKDYGNRGQLGQDGQLWYVYQRGDQSWEGKKDYGVSEYHTLMLGGMPATEISAVILRNPERILERVKQSVIENGFYIPIYDLTGKLLFTAAEYDRLRLDLNLLVPVEVWDYSLKTGEQRGSNPGAEFTIPTEEEPVKYYVKFASPENLAHIWVEDLADQVYRLLGIPVPDTKVVKVNGSYGHASRLLTIDTSEDNSAKKFYLKAGFLADAIMANWDISYAFDRNTVQSGGRRYRVDNGGALIFHARGERKEAEAFGPHSPVRELERGTDKKRLGLGMRQEYEALGLTDEDILRQASVIKDLFTDSTIDRLVDSVRIGEQDRSFLKKTLKHRRDYALEWVKNNSGEINVDLGSAGSSDKALLNLKDENLSDRLRVQDTATSKLDDAHVQDHPKERAITSPEYGGINLNPNTLNLQTQGDGVDFNPPFNPNNLEKIPINGLVPHIIEIVPVPDVPFLLGLSMERKQELSRR